MKTIIFFLLMFSFCYADEWTKADFDYRDYLLEGFLKKEAINEDYFWLWEFQIYDGKIFNLFTGDMGKVSVAISDGEYELITYNNSSIKISVKDGLITNFLLQDKKSFLENEKIVKDNEIYCKKGYFYAMQDRLYKSEKYKNYVRELIKDNPELKNVLLYKGTYDDNYYNNYYIYRDGDKYIVLANEGDQLVPIFNRWKINDEYYVENCLLGEYKNLTNDSWSILHNYENYFLTGNFLPKAYIKKNREVNFDFILLNEFFIYKNRIFNLISYYDGDKLIKENLEIIPNGEYELKTTNGSEFKVIVKDGLTQNIYIKELSPREGFLPSNCELVLFFSRYDRLYKITKNHLFINIYDSDNIADIFNYNNTIFIASFDDFITQKPEDIAFVLVEDESLNKVLMQTKKINRYTPRIYNCMVDDNNDTLKDILPMLE